MCLLHLKTNPEFMWIDRGGTRRVNRRHDYYYSLPKGCEKVIISGELYHYCNGIYYAETIDKSDTVFIIVNP